MSLVLSKYDYNKNMIIISMIIIKYDYNKKFPYNYNRFKNHSYKPKTVEVSLLLLI